MKTDLIEKILKSSKKINVLSFPVGIEIYLLNPFRICNISPDGEWSNLGMKLKTGFNRFIAFSKIKKIEKVPIGPDKEFILSDFMQSEFNKLKGNIEKPHAKLIWKIFWLNHLQEKYDKLPRDLEALEIKTMSNHAKAVVYHFLAINDSIKVLDDPKNKINISFWEKALEYWSQTFRDESFTGEIAAIIEHEIKQGNFEFRDYTIEKLINELVDAIFNTVTFIPLKLIEQDLSSSEANLKSRSQCISKFLGLILKSDLGSEKIRHELAKQLTENKISKEVTSLFKGITFKQWADKGDYRNLYDTGMKFIDKIHDATNQLKDDAHDKNIHTSTFLNEVPKIPSIHARVIAPLLEGVESLEIVNSQYVSREIKDKTFFTQLILCLRVLSELNVDIPTKGSLIKNLNDINKRFLFNKLNKEQINLLNIEKRALPDLYNCDICDKYYLAQYCYFLNGEFADPDASLYKTFETNKGIIKFTNYTFIPRSKLAADYHNSKISLDDLSFHIRNKTNREDLTLNLENLKSAKPQLIKGIADLEDKLKPFTNEKNKIDTLYYLKRKELAININKEKEDYRKSTAFLTRIRPLETEKNKIQDEIDIIPEKQAITGLTRKKSLQNKIGVTLLVLSVIYFFGSVISFHFYGLLGLIIIGFFGLLFIGNSEETAKKIKDQEPKIQDKTAKLNKDILKINKEIERIEKEADQEVEKSFQNETDKINRDENTDIEHFKSVYDVENIEFAMNEMNNELERVNNEIDSISNLLKNKDLIKNQQSAKNHPVVTCC
ncbi:MAG: hypothetical protein JXB00_12200 [Bacteroidales bacterium]|nr:hypothetical protein [Bacteroidales bacterium]